MRHYLHGKLGSHMGPMNPYDSSLMSNYTAAEELVNFSRRRLLVLTRIHDNSVFYVVPGFVENYRNRKTEHGIDITDVSEVPNSHKDAVIKFLRGKGYDKGGINFW